MGVELARCSHTVARGRERGVGEVGHSSQLTAYTVTERALNLMWLLYKTTAIKHITCFCVVESDGAVRLHSHTFVSGFFIPPYLITTNKSC
jgi:hypothetical protein